MILENLKNYHVLLASKSPRRRELLKELRIPFNSICLNGIDESYPEKLPRIDVPQYLADRKADAYLSVLGDNDLLITADTLVIKDDRILGKPQSRSEAIESLMFLSGGEHLVVTGVAIVTKDRRVSFSVTTRVKFAAITEGEARYYVDTFHPMDKAGAYGIQEWIGCIAVESIYGSFYNVMGLPIHKLYAELKAF